MIDDTYEMHPDIAAAMPQTQPEPQTQEMIEAQASQESPVESQSEPTASTHNNWAQMRTKLARAERERDEALRLAREEIAALKNNVPAPIEEDIDIGVGNDDIVEGKHLKKTYKEVHQLRKELNQYKKQYQEASAEIRLKQKYPDFYETVTEENIRMLAQINPSAVNVLNYAPDLYDKGDLAYTLIKQFNINEGEASNAQVALKNAAKPKPSNSISPQRGDNPLNQANMFANGLTDDLKKKMWEETNRFRKDF